MMVPLRTLEFTTITEGTALLTIGILALLLLASVYYSNPLAGLSWALTTMVFVLSVMLELGIEIFLIFMFGTLIILAAGLVVRAGVGHERNNTPWVSADDAGRWCNDRSAIVR